MHARHLGLHLQGKSRANAHAALIILQLRARENVEAAEVLAKVRHRALGGLPQVPSS